MPDSDILFCSPCQAYFEAGQGSLRSTVCPRCGRSAAPRAGSEENQPLPEINPYASPTASLAQSDDLAPDTEVPPGFWGKFAEAFRLLVANLGLFSLLVLTVWLPGNLVVRLAAMNAPEGDASFRLNTMIEGIFSPIYIGGVMHALRQRKLGQRVSYPEALMMGLRSWGRLWWAHVLTGLLIVLGFIALIVPGVILSIRYSLVDPIVVLESVGASTAMGRSATLSKTRRGAILGSLVLCLIVFLGLSVAFALAPEQVPALEIIWVGVTIDCVLDIIWLLSPIVMFLYYWEATTSEGRWNRMKGSSGAFLD